MASSSVVASHACRSAVAPLDLGVLADIASGLARTAGAWQRFVPKDPACRTGLRLISTDAYDAWLLRWPEGTGVGRHDHGDSRGAFTVVSGELVEVRWRGALRRTRLLGPGDVATIDAGVTHDVVAQGAGASASVHVYAPPLTAMGLYDDAGQRVGCEAVDATDVFASTRPVPGPVLGRA